MKNRYLFLTIAVFLSLQPLFPKVNRNGVFLSTTFTPEQYQGENQNWAIAQDSRGIIYVGNNAGVLEFDGSRWKLIPTGNRDPIRSLAIDNEGHIFVGAYGDFGMLLHDPQGGLYYRSLLTEKLKAKITVGDVPETFCHDNGVIFQSRQALFIYKDKRLSTVYPQGGDNFFHRSFSTNDNYYVREHGRGLLRYQKNGLVPVAGGELFALDRVYTMTPVDKDEIMVGSDQGGIYFFRPAADPKEAFYKRPEFMQIEKLLKGQKVTYCLRLDNNDLVFTTIQNGIYITSMQGELLYHIDKSNGLLDDVVYCIKKDRQGNLLLGHGSGITFLETASPFRIMDDKMLLSGSGNTAFHSSAGPAVADQLLLGTLKGLFRRDSAADKTSFAFIPGSVETWDIIKKNGFILTAHNSGVSLFENGRLSPLVTNAIAVKFAPLRRHPNLLLVGTTTGILLLEYKEKSWVFRHRLQNFLGSAYDLNEGMDGEIWLTADFGKEFVRLELAPDFSRVQRQEVFGLAEGLPALSGNRIFPGQKRLYFFTKKGIYRFAEKQRRFVSDETFPETHQGENTFCILFEDETNNVWLASSICCGVYCPQTQGNYRFLPLSLNRLRFFRLNEKIYPLSAQEILFGYTKGFIYYNANLETKGLSRQQVLIRQVQCLADNKNIMAGDFLDNKGLTVTVQAVKVPVLEFSRNQLFFNYSLPLHGGFQAAEYKTFLQGLDKGWSLWSNRTEIRYTNLGEGDYVFRVMARSAMAEESALAVFRFSVKPPWKRTFWAYILYFLCLGSIIFFAVHLNSRRLLREKEHLEKLVAEKTRELKEISLVDPLTGLRNRRFISEIIQPEIRTFVSFKKHLLESPDRRNNNENRKVFGVFVIDIDRFKAVNDQYGHEAGDLVLKTISMTLKGMIRDNDFLVRWGGEEFLIILKKTIPEYVREFAEKVRVKVADTPFIINIERNLILKKTCSIGYVSFPFYAANPGLLTLAQTVMLADLGLFQAKNSGRNRSVFLQPGDNPVPDDQLPLMLSSLKDGLANNWLSIDTRPKSEETVKV